MRVTARSAQHDRSSLAPRNGEQWTETAHDAAHHRRREMLVADAELARCPRFADLVHDRRQDLEVETLGFHPAGKQVLDLAPGRRFVASGHRRDQRVPPSAHLGVSPGGGAGWCSRGSLGVEECVEADRVDHPLAAALVWRSADRCAHSGTRSCSGRRGVRPLRPTRSVGELPLWVLLPSVRRRSSRRRGTRVAVQRLGACRPQISTNPMILLRSSGNNAETLAVHQVSAK